MLHTGKWNVFQEWIVAWQTFLKVLCIEGGQYVLLMVSVLWNKVCIPWTSNYQFLEVHVSKNSIQQERKELCCAPFTTSVSIFFFFLKKFEAFLCDLVGISTAFYLLLNSQISYPDCLKATNNPNYHFTSYSQLDTHALQRASLHYFDTFFPFN